MQPDNAINDVQKVANLKSSANNNLSPRQSIDIVNQNRDKSKDPKSPVPTIKGRAQSKKNGKSLFIILFTILIIAAFVGLLYLAYLKSK